MRRTRLLGRVFGVLAGSGLFFASGLVALAQSQNPSQDSGSQTIQGTPLAPPPNTSADPMPAPGGSAAGTPQAAGEAPTPPAPEPPPGTNNPGTPASSDWVQKSHADLILLDKIYGNARSLQATVGTPFQVRSLTITLLACWTRPPTLPPDSAAFIQVVDSHAPAGAPPEFRGWIFAAEPGLSGVTDATTDVSVKGCS
ncbi:DUF2155 domain-containing protein [Acidisoma sp. 7E03]